MVGREVAAVVGDGVSCGKQDSARLDTGEQKGVNSLFQNGGGGTEKWKYGCCHCLKGDLS